jgi:hypothetical protein
VKVFLDVDGVLLEGDRLAQHAVAFLQFVTKNFSCYWLTTHVRTHQTAAVFQHILRATPSQQHEELLGLMREVRPAPWQKWKTDALPRGGDFVWLDDSPAQTELELLRERGWLSRWLYVDVNDEPGDLLRARQWLEDRLQARQLGDV